MATNYKQPGDVLDVTFTSTANAAGDPVVVGQIAGVCLNDNASSASGAVNQVATKGVFDLSVKGIDGGGNSAVAYGDAIYFVSGDTPKLSKKATGVLFGYACGTVSSGATATISVKLKH